METLIELAKSGVEAGYRIRFYLRSLGILDSTALARITKKILDRISKIKNIEDVDQAAIDEVIRIKQDWFSVLSERSAQPGTALDPFVGWRFRVFLQKNPDFFLSVPDITLIDKDVKILQLTAVPRSLPAEMPAQKLGEVPAGLRKEFWLKVASIFKNTWLKLIGLL